MSMFMFSGNSSNRASTDALTMASLADTANRLSKLPIDEQRRLGFNPWPWATNDELSKRHDGIKSSNKGVNVFDDLLAV